MYKIDLHTHSQASPDGRLTAQDYRRMLETGRLHMIAVTDHDRVDFAQELKKELGDQIIVGEEITTLEGEMIGLFLKRRIKPGMSVLATAQAIHEQGGLVYIPHPFERLRKGVSAEALDLIAAEVDIIEVHNGRASLDAKPRRVLAWAQRNSVAMASSSDAHGRAGWGRSYSMVADEPTRENFVKLLFHADFHKGSVGLRGRAYPKFNRLRKRRSQ